MADDDECVILEEISSNVPLRPLQIHKCHKCKKKFEHKRTLYEHYTFEHYFEKLYSKSKDYFKKQWDCAKCGKTMKTMKQALAHIAISHQVVQEYINEDQERKVISKKKAVRSEVIDDSDDIIIYDICDSVVESFNKCFKCKKKSNMDLIEMGTKSYCMKCCTGQ